MDAALPATRIVEAHEHPLMRYLKVKLGEMQHFSARPSLALRQPWVAKTATQYELAVSQPERSDL